MADPISKFYAYGFLGYEVEFASNVRTHVIFGLADEKQTLIAWYGYYANIVLEKYLMNFDHIRLGWREPDLVSTFATANLRPSLKVYPGRFGIHQLVDPPVTLPILADLDLHDNDDGSTRCVLSVPSVRPKGMMFDFSLRSQRKRRTLDMTKRGNVLLISIEKFSQLALVDGPNRINLRQQHFRPPSARP